MKFNLTPNRQRSMDVTVDMLNASTNDARWRDCPSDRINSVRAHDLQLQARDRKTRQGGDAS